MPITKSGSIAGFERAPGVTIKTLDGTTVYGANTRERGIKIDARASGEFVDIIFAMENNLAETAFFEWPLTFKSVEHRFDGTKEIRVFDAFEKKAEAST